MDDHNELIEEIRALSAEAEKARGEFHSAAVRLADAVLLNRNNAGDIRNAIAGEISAYTEADKRYTKAVSEVTAACARLSQFVSNRRKGGAK